ncbi:MAG: flagellin [Pseudomonadota bacterium]
MTFLSIGDLAQIFQTRRETATLTADLQRLTQEVASGRRNDLRSEITGDFGSLAAIESSLARITSFSRIAGESVVELDTAQAALGRIEADGQRVASALLLSQTASQPNAVDAAAREAGDAFASAIATLNTTVGGRSLFAGVATDGPALLPAEQILTDLETAVAGATTAADLRDAVFAWFAPGGGFETGAYVGSATEQAPRRISPEAQIDPLPRANDPAIAGVLSGAALAALVDRGALIGQPEERLAAAGFAGERLLSATPDFIGLRANLGVEQETLALAQQALVAEQGAFEIARADLISADPFTAASELEATRSQLETLYLLTSRLSQLSLTSFLR